jgi:hypothetical protein
MNQELNPYKPPSVFQSDIHAFAKKYRVMSSKTTLREFQNISGRPILGTFCWLAMQVGLLNLNRQIIDGPRPFAGDQCAADELREPTKSHLLAIEKTAKTLGFHSPCYSVSNSTGLVVHGGEIRMLHESSRMFLQIIASSSGAVMKGHQLLVSATLAPTMVFVSSNGPPNYNVLPDMRIQSKTGATLPSLVELHHQLLCSATTELARIDSIEMVGTVMDYLAKQFFTDKIKRGIFVPLASKPDP